MTGPPLPPPSEQPTGPHPQLRRTDPDGDELLGGCRGTMVATAVTLAILVLVYAAVRLWPR